MENTFIPEKLLLRLTFNPRLALTGFRTTRPCCVVIRTLSLWRQRSTPVRVTCLICFIHHDHSLYSVQFYYHGGPVLLHRTVVPHYGNEWSAWQHNNVAMVNNYSPKWRWIVMDIYRAAKRRGKYPSLSPTLRWIIALVYTTQAE